MSNDREAHGSWLMAHGSLHIRPGMDVYSAYQDEYIGSVVRVWRSDDNYGTESERGAGAVQTGSASGTTQANPELTHEEGAEVDPTRHIGSKQLGEEMGPFPTMALGNTGPRNQSASRHYATDPEDSPANVRYFAVRPGRINLGPLTRPLYIPASAVQSVSMERVVLDVQKDRIPDDWRRRPLIP